MQYKMIVWRQEYGIFETDATGRPRGKPLEAYKGIQEAAKRVRELNEAQDAEALAIQKKKKKK
jgi:hypothetical protein